MSAALPFLSGKPEPSVTLVLCVQDDCSEDGTLAEDSLNCDSASKRSCRQ